MCWQRIRNKPGRRGRERLLSALGQFAETKMWERVEMNRRKKKSTAFFFFYPDIKVTRTHDAAMKED